jgi:hypothetical protein
MNFGVTVGAQEITAVNFSENVFQCSAVSAADSEFLFGRVTMVES